jgi:NTE family protein
MPDAKGSFDINASSPVDPVDTGSKPPAPQPGIALCLSGGGYRAMLFHLGSLWRLNEAGMLSQIDRISSVSGGSILAAFLGLNWSKLTFNEKGIAARFPEWIVDSIRLLAKKTIDAPAIIGGVFGPKRVSDKLIKSYRKYLFGNHTLQHLPDKPRFVLNASNVQSGALWRFMKPYMRDYRVGEVKIPKIHLAVAVAASSAFPPVLSPVVLKLKSEDYTPNSGMDLQREPFTNHIVLSDGGVYDNLGLETAWKRYTTVLVSDGGGKMKAEERPKRDWVRHSYRVLSLIDNQVRSLRKRQVIDSFVKGIRKGAYWSIQTDIANYELEGTLPCPLERTIELAEIPTRLKRLDSLVQERLINWGYAVCDAALRRYVNNTLPMPRDFVYPSAGV